MIPFRAMTLSICMLISIAATGQTSSRNVDEQNLIKIENLLNDADARHDARLAAQYLDDVYLVKNFYDGKVYDKSKTLQAVRHEAKANHKDSAPILEEPRVAILDTSALVTFDYTVVMDKATLRCHLTDTFLKRGDVWKLVGRAGTCH